MQQHLNRDCILHNWCQLSSKYCNFTLFFSFFSPYQRTKCTTRRYMSQNTVDFLLQTPHAVSLLGIYCNRKQEFRTLARRQSGSSISHCGKENTYLGEWEIHYVYSSSSPDSDSAKRHMEHKHNNFLSNILVQTQHTGLFKMIVGVQLSSGNSARNSGKR